MAQARELRRIHIDADRGNEGKLNDGGMSSSGRGSGQGNSREKGDYSSICGGSGGGRCSDGRRCKGGHKEGLSAPSKVMAKSFQLYAEHFQMEQKKEQQRKVSACCFGKGGY